MSEQEKINAYMEKIAELEIAKEKRLKEGFTESVNKALEAHENKPYNRAVRESFYKALAKDTEDKE